MILRHLRTALLVMFQALLVASPSRQGLADDSVPPSRPPAFPMDPNLVDILAFDPNDPEYDFLEIGVENDYLGVERQRIIDQIETFIPPLYTPVRPFHAFTLPPGALRVTLSNTIFKNDSDFGRDDDFSTFFSDVEVRNLFVDLDVSYGFEFPGSLGKDWVVNLNIPYRRTNIRGEGHPFSINNIVMSMEGDSEGLGDVSLAFKKKWLDQGNDWLNLATFFGVIFPTGEHEENFNDSQTLIVNGMPMAVSGRTGGPVIDVFGPNREVPNSVQPGTGAWGARVGVAVTRQLERSAVHAGVFYQFYGNNSAGVKPGNELRYGAAYVLPVLNSDVLALDLSVFGRYKEDESFPGTIMRPVRDPATGDFVPDPVTGGPQMIAAGRPDFPHGNVVFVSPSIIFAPRPNIRITASPSFRIAEPSKGPTPAFMFNFGLSVIF